MSKIRILLADDHNVLREGIAQVLESQPDITVVAQAKDGAEAVALAQQHQPDIALLDIHMPEMDGIQATREIQKVAPDTRVIILTMYRTSEYVMDAIRAGALGYILKEAEMKDLLGAVRAVAQGEAILDPLIASKVMGALRAPKDTAKQEAPHAQAGGELAARDTEILRLVGRGLSNADIAAQISLSEKTVRNRLSQIFKQLGLKNRTEAAIYAAKKGLVDH